MVDRFRAAPLSAKACYVLAGLAVASLALLAIVSIVGSGLSSGLSALFGAPRIVVVAVAFWTLGRICQDTVYLADRARADASKAAP